MIIVVVISGNFWAGKYRAIDNLYDFIINVSLLNLSERPRFSAIKKARRMCEW